MPTYETKQQTRAPCKSSVQIRFTGKGMALTAYSNRFDLKPGDRVYVDGKLEAQPGRITEVNHHFKNRASDGKKVIAV